MVLPIAASAQTTNINDLIAQTQALIAQINALQGKTGQTQTSQNPINAAMSNAPTITIGANTATGATAGSGTAAASVCPSLSRVLAYGAKGSDVSSLQQFLAQDASVYPERQVSGFFGALTQAAVQRWQAKNGIVSSGTPSSTGYGVVGPRTKSAMMSACAGAQAGVTGVASGFIEVAPAVGTAPLTVTVTATINTTNSCSGTAYMIDFGDGLATRQIISTVGNCNQQIKAFTHTYTAAGVYTVTLAAGGHQTTASVTVKGNGVQSGGVDSITPSVTSGTTPLSVTFTGTVSASDAGNCIYSCVDSVNFGDGTSLSVPLPTIQAGYQTYTNYTVTHTYNQPGSFTASLTSGTTSTNALQTFAFTPITVTGSPVSATSLTISTGANYVAQGSTLPITWQSQGVTAPSSVGLWLVNVQTGALFPLAMTLNTNGNINAPIPASASQGTVPPIGAYVVLGKIYAPPDAVLTGTTPVYGALGRSNTFNITAAANAGTFAIQSLATGVGGNQSSVTMKISYPTCATYVVDWGDGGQLQTGGGASSNCNVQATLQLNHLYQNNGTVVIRLNSGDGVQQASAAITIANAGTTSKYGILSVTPGVNSSPLYLAVQLTIPACPSFTLDWGDGTLPVSQTAATGCTGTATQTPTYNHPYSQPGKYILKLTDASSTLQSSSSISLSTTTTQ